MRGEHGKGIVMMMFRVENRGVIPGGCIRAKVSLYEEMRVVAEPPAKHLRNASVRVKRPSGKSGLARRGKRKVA